MGARGPLPRSAALRAVNGRSPGKDSGGRRIPLPPKAIATTPEKPDGLSPKESEHWDVVLADLEESGLPITPGMVGSLTRLCVAHSEWDDLRLKVARTGRLAKRGTGGVMSSPLIADYRAAGAEYDRLAREFGLTPVSRARVAASGDEPSGANPFAWAGDR